MRTTHEIKKKLDFVLSECERINKYLYDHPEETINSKFVFKDGKTTHTSWTFNDAITSLVAEKLLLQWILKMNY
ncbi:MAG: hypothetical protein ACOYN4_00580 [Bacteroidales bacterium]